MRAPFRRAESTIILAAVMSCGKTQVAGPTAPASAVAPTPVAPAFTAQVLSAPRRLVRTTTTSAVYELVLRNQGAAPLRLAAVDVLGPVEPVLTWAPGALGEDLALLWPDAARASGLRREQVAKSAGPDAAAAPPRDAAPIELPPGRDAVLYVWLDQDAAGRLPERLVNRVRVIDAGGREQQVLVETSVSAAGPAVLAPPLRGGGWFTANAPHARSPHRRALFQLEGGYFLAQRFAVDLVRVSQQGKTFTGDPTDNKSYHAWGAEVLAVADGVVREVLDGVPENTPGGCQRPMDLDAACDRSSAVKMTNKNLTGNTVVLEIDPGTFVIYAHLRPGSMAVKVGDRVTRGQVLAALGNSGNSTEPHLHLHVCDRMSVLACEGLPFAFDAFVEQPIDVRKGPTGAPALRREAMPIDSALVHFPPFPEAGGPPPR